MCCGQDSRKHFVRDRRPHKIASDVPPLENHAVDGCPLMVGELSITGTQPVGRRTHTTLPGYRFMKVIMGWPYSATVGLVCLTENASSAPALTIFKQAGQ